MMMDIERIVPGGVICLYSAWNYYNLTTQIPNGFYIAIEKHRKVVAPKMTDIILCYWEEKYCSLGVEEVVIANHNLTIASISLVLIKVLVPGFNHVGLVLLDSIDRLFTCTCIGKCSSE